MSPPISPPRLPLLLLLPPSDAAEKALASTGDTSTGVLKQGRRMPLAIFRSKLSWSWCSSAGSLKSHRCSEPSALPAKSRLACEAEKLTQVGSPGVWRRKSGSPGAYASHMDSSPLPGLKSSASSALPTAGMG